MFISQLAAFLTTHHHVIWASRITVNIHTFDTAYQWALAKGFIYQR
jgi:hypothetical protein